MAGTVEESATAAGRSVVVYDGQCGMCRRSVELVRRRDALGAFRFVSSDSEGLLEAFPRLRGEDLDDGIRLLTPDGRLHAGSEAVGEIAARLPGYRALGWILRVPLVRGAARRVYAWIARNRMALSHRCEAGGACRIGGGAGEEGARGAPPVPEPSPAGSAPDGSGAGSRPGAGSPGRRGPDGRDAHGRGGKRTVLLGLGALAFPLLVAGHGLVAGPPSIDVAAEVPPGEVATLDVTAESEYVHLRGRIAGGPGTTVQPLLRHSDAGERTVHDGSDAVRYEGYVAALRVEGGEEGARLRVAGRTHDEHGRAARNGLFYGTALLATLAAFLGVVLRLPARLRRRSPPPPAGEPERRRAAFGVGLLGLLVLVAAALQVAEADGAEGLATPRTSPAATLVVNAAILWAALFLVAGLARLDRAPVTGPRIGIRPSGRAWLWGLAGLVAAGAAAGAAGALLRGLGPVETSLAFVPTRGLFPVVVLAGLSAGICEEVVYRGYLLSRLERLTGSRVAAVALPSLLFALTHLAYGTVTAVVIGVVGAVLGALTLWRRNLAPAIWAHCALDLLAAVSFLGTAA